MESINSDPPSSTHRTISPTSCSSSMIVEPGRCIGPFFIGMEIGTALVVAAQYEERPQLLFHLESLFEIDIALDLETFDFRLCFDGYTQKLHVIIVNVSDISKPSPGRNEISQSQESGLNVLRSLLTFTFQNVTLMRFSKKPPDLRYIYRVCGPTIPGHYSKKNLNYNGKVVGFEEKSFENKLNNDDNSQNFNYYLKYPGLAFRFEIPIKDYEELRIQDEDQLPLVLPVTSKQSNSQIGPLLNQLIVFPADLPLRHSDNPPWVSPIPITIQRTSESKIPYSLIPKNRPWNLNAIIRKGIWLSSGACVRFGAALQDVYAELGPPDKVSLKDIDVVGVMAGHVDFKKSFEQREEEEETFQSLGFAIDIPTTTGNDSPPNYFCNYFQKGLDLLVCGNSHRVKKFILHSNLPGHCRFGDYSRCFFSVPLQSKETEEKVAIDIDSTWEDIQQYLGQPSPPLLVDPQVANESHKTLGSGVRKFYGYPGIVVEIFKNHWIASITLF